MSASYRASVLAAFCCLFYVMIVSVAQASGVNNLDCSSAKARQAVLWPPNHQFHSVTIDNIVSPDGAAVLVNYGCIRQDEPVNAEGDGNTDYDAFFDLVTGAPFVRSERSGQGNGRVYHIGFTATHPSGGRCEGVVQVGVPKSKKQTAIDDGPHYNSMKDTSLCDGSNNQAPIADDIQRVADEDITINIPLAAQDPDGDALSYTVVTEPLFGILSGQAPNLIYTPFQNYFGDDTFTYVANDGELDSNVAQVRITINSVNDAPTAQA